MKYGIHVVAVEIRRVVEVSLKDLVVAGRRVVALAAAGNCRDADKFVVLVEGSGLLVQIDDDGRRSGNATVIPVGLLQGHAFLGGGIDDRPARAEVFDLTAVESRVVAGARSKHQRQQGCSNLIKRTPRVHGRVKRACFVKTSSKQVSIAQNAQIPDSDTL